MYRLTARWASDESNNKEWISEDFKLNVLYIKLFGSVVTHQLKDTSISQNRRLPRTTFFLLHCPWFFLKAPDERIRKDLNMLARFLMLSPIRF